MSPFDTAVVSILRDLKFWENPIFIRYRRSRLRPRSVIAWGLVVLILTGFTIGMTYFVPQRAQSMTRLEAAQLSFVPLFIIQCAIMMFKASFGVASGITREGIEGVLDYQRLTPLSPRQKIIGYLFGLPVLDYLLFAITMPFLAFIVIQGQIPMRMLVSVYSVFGTSVLLYHITAYMAGMIVTRRHLAGFISQTLMFGLYFILPNMKGFGYVFFEYLTVRPAIFYELTRFMPDVINLDVAFTHVDFFEFDVSVIGFSLIAQALMFWVFALVIYRKWQKETHHILGKRATVIVFTGIMLVLIGSMIPLIEPGRIFPSQATRYMLELPEGRFIGRDEAILIPGGFGVVTLILGIVLVAQMTPSRDKQMKGWRKAFKYGQPRIERLSDASSSILYTLSIAGIGALCWSLLRLELHASDWYTQWDLTGGYWIWTTLALALPLMVFQMVREIWDNRGVFILCISWFALFLLGTIFAAAAEHMDRLWTHILVLSGFAFPLFAIDAGIIAEPGQDSAWSAQAFFAAIALYGSGLPYLVGRWRQHHRSLRDEVGHRPNS